MSNLKSKNLPKIKEGYFKHTLNSKFQTKKLFYIMWMPMQMSNYNKLKTEIEAEFGEIDWNTGMIEAAKIFGFGKIGLNTPNGDMLVQGDFIAYKIVGDYKQMKKAYQKIMKDYPRKDYDLTEMYNLYLTDPNTTRMEDNITYILFR